MRPFRFAIHLQEYGWKPTVLTIATPGQRLTSKEEHLLRDVDVVEITTPFDRTTRSESQLGLASSHRNRSSPGPAARLLQKVDQQFPIDTWMLLFLAKYGQLLEVVRQVSPHVIWATGDPWSSLVIGRRLARRLRIPFFPDFRDPWTLSDIRKAEQWKAPQAVDRYFERLIVRDADVVIFQTPRVEASYQRHYAELDFASTTIPNSFDPSVFDDDVDVGTATAQAVSDGEGLAIGFFGRFRKMSPATLIVDILAALRRMDASVAEDVDVYSFGPLPEADRIYAADRGVDENFKTRRPVPLERALASLREFDLLLLSTEPSRTEIIPAKLFEYLAAGRPILSLSRNPTIDDILRKTGTGVQITDSARAADLLRACRSARRAGEPMPIPFQPNPTEIRKYDARTTTGDLATIFDRIVDPTTIGPVRARH